MLNVSVLITTPASVVYCISHCSTPIGQFAVEPCSVNESLDLVTVRLETGRGPYLTVDLICQFCRLCGSELLATLHCKNSVSPRLIVMLDIATAPSVLFIAFDAVGMHKTHSACYIINHNAV